MYTCVQNILSHTTKPVLQPRTEIIRTALVQQLAVSETELRAGKTSLETALAMDQDLVQPTNVLEDINKAFKESIRQANLHLPKPKAKAKAAA